MIVSTVEMHTSGEPTRIIVGGWPDLAAPTLLGKRRECLEKHDHLRRGLMLEPRGHDGMYGALLVEPDHPEADLAVLSLVLHYIADPGRLLADVRRGAWIRLSAASAPSTIS